MTPTASAASSEHARHLPVLILIVFLALPAHASSGPRAGWLAAVALGSRALLPVAVLAAQTPRRRQSSMRPRAAWVLAAVAAAVMAVAYDPLLDPTCPLTCAPLPGTPRLGADQSLVRWSAAVLVTGSVLLRRPNVRPLSWRLLAVHLTVALTLATWWGGAIGVMVPAWIGVAGVGLAVLHVAVVNARRILRRRRARAVALALQSAPLDAPAGEDVLEALTSAERLALTNARLEAATEARAAQVRGCRADLLAALDTERARLGADLHDLGQQRLVGVLLCARGLAARPETAPHGSARLSEAADRLTRVLDQVRSLSVRGGDGLLASAGLLASIRARLADIDIDVTGGDLGEVPTEQRRHAIATVESVVAATGDVPLGLDLHREENEIVLTFHGWSGPMPLDVRDRVDALGGRIVSQDILLGSAPNPPGRLFTEIRLPCGS